MTSININKIPMNMTISVRVTRRLRFRLWLGIKIMALGGRISGAAVSVDVDRGA